MTAPHNTSAILVAGVGNIFLSDDGFGVEVARRLARETLPTAVSVADYGIRSVHLAYQLLEPYSAVILVDAVSRGGAAGTLYVIDPEADKIDSSQFTVSDAHGLDLNTLFGAVRSMGGTLNNVRIVGCEPQSLEEGMGLTPVVAEAVERAVHMVRDLVAQPGAIQS